MFPYFFRTEEIASKGNSNHIASSCSSSSTSTVNSEPAHPSIQNIELSDWNRRCDEGGYLGGYRRDCKNVKKKDSKSICKRAKNGIKKSHSQYSPHHDRNSSDSNSSTEDSQSRRVAMMMASSALPPRCREKQRRRTRASSRRTSDGAKSGPSEPLCSDEYFESNEKNDVRSRIAVRRRSSKLTSGATAPSSKRRYSSQDTKRSTKQSHDDFPLRKPHQSEYYSPEFYSESSCESSPTRLISDVYRLDQYQHLNSTPQEQMSSNNTLSRSANDSFTGSTDSYYPKLNSRNSPIQHVSSSKNFKTAKTNPITSNKYCSLALTFLGIVILSINGMIFLTERAAPTTIKQEQYVASLFNQPDDGGIRGKQVLGRMWDTSATNSEDLGSSHDLMIIKGRAQKSQSNISRPSSFRNVAVSSRRHSGVKKVFGASALPNRLQMHAPPYMSSKIELKFDSFDRNLYYSSSISRNGKDDFLPRIVMLDPAVKRVSRKIKKYPADFTDNTQLYGILPSDDERLSRMEIRDPYSNDECIPMQEWQTTYKPSCNGMHELALESLGASSRLNEQKSPKRWDRGELEGLNASLFGTKGFWRYAWKVVIGHYDHRKAEEDTVVFKNLKYEHNFEDAHFEHDRIDAVAMERLTSSPHVINIFGFCGHSVMTEYADGKRIGELADKSKKTPLKRLEIARDIANGLADVHGIDGDGNVTFVHLDINPANVVSVNNTLKLNDFNIGIIRQWNTTSNEACGFPTQYPNPQWRSPEEARNEQHLTEKVDVFSLGHIFFRLICGHEPWNKLEPGVRPTKAEINEKVQRGELPFIPDHVRSSDDPEVVAVRDAMLKCYSFDPSHRPSARYIANRLDRTLKFLKKKKSS